MRRFKMQNAKCKMRKRTRQVLMLAFNFEFFILNSALGQDRPLVLSLDDYTQRAIQQGIQGLQNQLTFENAGYTRQIAFRQTDSPTLAASASGTRSQSIVSGNPPTIDPLTGLLVTNNGQEKTDTGQVGLNLHEPLPTGTNINATIQKTDTYQSGFGQSSSQGQPNASLSITQPLYIFVKNSVARTRRQAELAYQNAKDSFDTAVLSIRTQARSLYYAVMQAEESIKVDQRKVDSSRKLLEITQALVDAGRSAPVETMRVKIQMQTDQRQLENAVVGRDKAVLSAKNFIYLPLEKPVRFSTQLQFKTFSLPMQRLVDYAMLHQPQLKTLRQAQELARLSYEASVEPTRPTLSLNSGYTYAESASTSLGNGVSLPTPAVITRGWNVGGTANWTFFDSNVTRDQVDIAKIGQRVAALNLADGERTTRLNVENAYLDVKRVEKQILDFQASREQAAHNVDIVRLRFRSGLERLIDVFDAENQTRDLDNEYLGLLVSYNTLKDTLSLQVGADVDAIE